MCYQADSLSNANQWTALSTPTSYHPHPNVNSAEEKNVENKQRNILILPRLIEADSLQQEKESNRTKGETK